MLSLCDTGYEIDSDPRPPSFIHPHRCCMCASPVSYPPFLNNVLSVSSDTGAILADGQSLSFFSTRCVVLATAVVHFTD